MLARSLFAGIAAAALAAAQGPALSGIAHAAFRVGNLAEARAFYEKLGFEQAFEFSKAGQVTESFIKINDRQFIELYPHTGVAGSQPPGLMHLCFESNDLEALHAEYLKREVKVTAAQKGGAGNLLFALHDADGQLVEYTQYLPGSMHFKDHGQHLGERRISAHLQGAVVPVQNLAAERVFYTGKLAFEEDGVRLRLPGTSGEEVRFRQAGPGAPPGLVFEVSDLRRAAQQLRSRGLAVKARSTGLSVTGPDGVILTFETGVRY